MDEKLFLCILVLTKAGESESMFFGESELGVGFAIYLSQELGV